MAAPGQCAGNVVSQTAHHVRCELQRSNFTLQVDLQLPAQGITVLFGASGSGKTTLLRCVAGLERPSQALIRIAGEVWHDDTQKVFCPTWRRPLGYVFQDANLFEHLDVQANLDYGLRRLRQPAAPDNLAAAIELLGIGHLLRRRVQNLSGGERQRVAIARALSLQPALLLLDEPLASLDLARRNEILPWLERLRDEVRIPMLYVTHAMDEVVRLADTLVVLEQGRVQASGPVSTVLNGGPSAQLWGDDLGAFFDGVVLALDSCWHLAQVGLDGGGAVWLGDTGLRCGQRVRLRVLARDVSLTCQPVQATTIQNQIPCTVLAMTAGRHPSQTIVQLQCGSTLLWAKITARAANLLGLQCGQSVWAQVKSVALAG